MIQWETRNIGQYSPENEYFLLVVWAPPFCNYSEHDMHADCEKPKFLTISMGIPTIWTYLEII